MKAFLIKLREIAVAGFFFLLPVYILFIVIAKAWKSLSSVSTHLAGMFGIKSVLGIGGASIVAGLLIIGLWIVCGLLVRISFVAALNRMVEGWLSKFIPGYQGYRAIAEEKLHLETKILPYTSALVRQEGYWRPSYIIEQDDSGNYVVFLPNIPDTQTGKVVLATEDQVRVVSSLTANQLDAVLKKRGKGLLSECNLPKRT